MSWRNFEHKLYHDFQELGIKPSGELLLAVSGGVDSMALLCAMKHIAPALGLSVRVAHVVHGLSWQHSWQSFYRHRVWRGLRKYSAKLGLPFQSNYLGRGQFRSQMTQVLRSEDALRSFRWETLLDLRKSEADWIVTGHHIEDQLETRILRLIRGTGTLGLKAMREFEEEPFRWRPLLSRTKKEISKYVEERGIPYWQDPSNLNLSYRRNWVRHKLLPLMESYQSGSVGRLAQSLEVIAQGQHVPIEKGQECLGEDSINRSALSVLSRSDQGRTIACYMRQLNLQNYSQNHVNEVLKRLDRPQKRHNFRLLQCEWFIDAEQIKAIPIESSF
tara:strand:- start:39003 stop:39995 length:993 start_codon:yes stop_codon:yes gene_type:complete